MNFGWVSFGKVKFGDDIYDHDVIVSTEGEVFPRVTKEHIVTADELESSVDDNTKQVLIGTGMYGAVKIEDDAKAWAKDNKIKLLIEETPKAVEKYNKMKSKKTTTVILHLTC